MRSRVGALVRKELLEVSRNPGILVPVAVVGALTVLLPFVVTVGIPFFTGEGLGADRELLRMSALAGQHADLGSDGRVQLYLHQQFLLLFLLLPMTGAMSVASHSVIGEKEARTLEPLLLTPISTLEPLVAKVAAALVPTLAISFILFVLYLAGIGWLSEPGVLRAMLDMRTAALVALVGPAVALLSLQLAIVISSRVNDPRTAQQFGVLIIIPLAAVLVAQATGWVWLSAGAVSLVGLGLLAAWVAVALVSAALFDRETILTRWR